MEMQKGKVIKIHLKKKINVGQKNAFKKDLTCSIRYWDLLQTYDNGVISFETWIKIQTNQPALEIEPGIDILFRKNVALIAVL